MSNEAEKIVSSVASTDGRASDTEPPALVAASRQPAGGENHGASPVRRPVRRTAQATADAERSLDGTRMGLDDAIDTAYTLLRYAASGGIAIDAATIKAIADARRAHENGKLTVQNEVAFWDALEKVSVAVKPRTVKSLRAIDPAHGRETRRFVFVGRRVRCSEAHLAARHFRFIAMATLFVLLLVQIYWLLGNSSLRYLSELNGAIAAAKAGQDSLAVEILLSQKNAFFRFLQGIVFFEDYLLEGVSGAEYSEAMSFVAPKLMENMLVVLSLFVLPILYGLLGACTYVIRRLSEDIANISYTPDLLLRYGLRLILGLLCGLSAAWFLPIDLTSTADNAVPLAFLRAVAPWALAFLAGYSVELLFSALDRVVSAFIDKPRSA